MARVLITGGGAGIGAAIAGVCRDAGWEVVTIDRAGGDISADLSSADATAAALEEALSGGPITRLVNNVGMVAPKPLEEQTLAEFDAVMQLNLRCAMQCAQALLPGMKAAGFGRIVNMASRAALGKEMRTVYSASKAGLIGMAKTWALELGPYGVTANAIGPGPIATELFDKANPPGHPRTQAIIDAVPVKRVGTPADVAHAARYLLSDEAGFVTGQCLYVCGGMTVGRAGA